MDEHDTPQSSNSRRGVGPRLYHKKSRMGCARCKARRVKCDEKRPACGSCSRHQVECVYPAKTDVHRDVAQVQPLHPAPSVSFWTADHEASAFEGSNTGLDPFADASSIFSSDTFAASASEDPSLGNALSLSAEPLLVTDAQGIHASRSLLNPSLKGPASLADPSFEAARTASTGSDNSSPSSAGASLVREATDYLSQLTDPDILDIPESKERRIWELRLMHNFMMYQIHQFTNSDVVARHGEQPMPGVTLEKSDLDPNNPESRNKLGNFLWAPELLNLAFQNDAVLYSVLAASALEMWTQTSDSREQDHLYLLQQKYQSMALREQRQAVANLSRDNADDVCIAALTILQNSFILVQTLPASPWQPPLDWLRMGKGTGAVLVVARGYLGFRNGDDKITRFISSIPRISMNDVFKPEHRTHLTWLLENDGGSSDNIGDYELVNDEVTLNIYHKVLSCIGYMQKATDDKEPLYLVLRRFSSFALWVPELYHEFLAQKRPRALITLAHFFKLWIPYGDVWQFGKKTGENQVRGIYEECPPEWRHKLGPIFEEYGLEPPASTSPTPVQSDRMEDDSH